MNFIQSLRMAFSTLLAKKGRSFLTMLGTVIGVTAVISLVSVTKAQNEANRDLWMKMSENMVYVYFYSYAYNGAPPNSVVARDLKAYIDDDLSDMTTGISPNSSDYAYKGYGYGIGPLRWKGREIEEQSVYYGSEQFSLCKMLEIESGRDLSYMDIESSNRVCVIGSMLKERLFSYRDPIGEIIYIKNQPFEVVGVYKQFWKRQEGQTEEDFERYSQDNMLVVPYTAKRLINPEDWEIRDYMIKVDNPDTAFELVDLLNEFLGTMINRFDYDNYDWNNYNPNDFNNVNGDYRAYTNFQYYDETKDAEDAQTRTLTLIAAISLVVGGIGIMNIMLVTVTERTREIGVRKAIGAPRRSIVTQFLIEAVVLSGLGGLIGVLIGFIVTLYWGKMQYDLIASPDLPITIIAFIGSLAMGILFGIYPAAKAANLQPVDALRTE